MQHLKSENIFKIGQVIFEFTHYKQTIKYFLFTIGINLDLSTKIM